MRNKITNEQFDAEIVRLAGLADRTRDLGLQKIERLRRFAGAAATREIARLRARDGADAASTVTEASTMLGRARNLTRLREDIKAVSLGTRVGKDTIALGKIVTTGGRPAVGTRVAMSTDTEKAIGEALVDDAGLFVFDLPRERFDRLVEGARSIVFVVRDKAGRELDRLARPIRTRGAIVLTRDISKRPGVPTGAAEPSQAGLEDIRGLGRARIARLTKAGIRNAADLARTDPATLASLLRVSARQAEDYIQKAQSIAG